MSKRDTLLLLDDMLQSARKIKQYTKYLDYNAFLADDKTIDAVVRNFEIIGEAANRIDPDFRGNHDQRQRNAFALKHLVDFFKHLDGCLGVGSIGGLGKFIFGK